LQEEFEAMLGYVVEGLQRCTVGAGSDALSIVVS